MFNETYNRTFIIGFTIYEECVHICEGEGFSGEDFLRRGRGSIMKDSVYVIASKRGMEFLDCNEYSGGEDTVRERDRITRRFKEVVVRDFWRVRGIGVYGEGDEIMFAIETKDFDPEICKGLGSKML